MAPQSTLNSQHFQGGARSQTPLGWPANAGAYLPDQLPHHCYAYALYHNVCVRHNSSNVHYLVPNVATMPAILSIDNFLLIFITTALASNNSLL